MRAPTARPPLGRPVTPACTGLWCESTVSDGRREWMLAGYPAHTPRLALRWLTTHALRLADRINPPPEAPWLPAATLRQQPDDGYDPAGHLRDWATTAPAHDHALAAMREGSLYRVTTHDDTLTFSLSVRPLLASTPATPYRPGHHMHTPTQWKRFA